VLSPESENKFYEVTAIKFAEFGNKEITTKPNTFVFVFWQWMWYTPAGGDARV